MRTIAVLLVAVALGSPAAAAPPRLPKLTRDFDRTVRPFLKSYCTGCHGKTRPKAKFDLSPFTSIDDVRADLGHWKLVLGRLKAGEMPPKKAARQPSRKERQKIVRWIEDLRMFEAYRNDGDPGPVLARRLNNAEYDYTIRDLTGVDIRPTREFPVDPANTAGFANSGESLAMTPALFQKHLAAARHVAEHLVLLPTGFTFAPHPALTDSDRDKFAVRRIVDFYLAQNTSYADFLLAAWRFRHRAVLGEPGMTRADAAASVGVSEKYLATFWDLLHDGKNHHGPIAGLRDRWNALPAPVSGDRGAVLPRSECGKIRDWILAERKKREFSFTASSIPQLSGSMQPSVLWKNRLIADHRRKAKLTEAEKQDPDLRLAIERFCSAIPDRFVLTERGRMNLPFAKQNKGRLLGAGFHLQVGYYRDDRPLCDLVLSKAQKARLDEMWRELFFVTNVLVRQFQDFVYFERAESSRIFTQPEFDFARGEDREVASKKSIEKIAERFVAAVRNNKVDDAGVKEVERFFVAISRKIQRVEKEQAVAEPVHFESLLKFAARAWRRPLTKEDKTRLLDFYAVLRQPAGQGHEEAIRDVMVSILVSPYFSYRVDIAEDSGGKRNRLTEFSLANRLSYFLWSSMPDEALMRTAESGRLHQPAVLVATMKRMLKDDRSRALAVEFGGSWLGFRQFQRHVGVDRTRFTQFTDRLRESMFQEPVHFMADLIQRDGSVREFLQATHTFVDRDLAKHYQVPWTAEAADREGWMRFDDARSVGRGGILPMAVFLTKNSPGLRTSPVKRGYWVVKQLLGETIPAPPAEVPEIPDDESKLGKLTLRQVMEKHREVKSCAVCHDRFDFAGLVFEGYGPIGERRTKDRGGKPIDDSTEYSDGTRGRGLESLQKYLVDRRGDQFYDNLCRKLVAYGLGRTLLLSDEPMITRMKKSMSRNDDRFSSLVEVIVTSPQFLYKRGREKPDPPDR